ncbi:hypothetical protein [Photobacterium angustum]|uniref:hypothetical protein n=1 Tax=Photobacterium angustum TaxID=661 RepID=UPI0009BABAE2|nr:hypothetical protein [Photobacterium angustum]PSV95095.1 hypothetical protein CTN01_05775 [Photobacterium angustum]PSW80162.1 hypothetical protein CTN03_12750 [Photobacterium angustum]
MKYKKYSKKLLSLLILSSLGTSLIGCGSGSGGGDEDHSHSESHGSFDTQKTSFFPISGLALDNNEVTKNHLGDSSLAVFDYKNMDGEVDLPRFGTVRNQVVVEIPNSEITGLNDDEDGITNDLEAICKLDNTYYLAAESGYHQGKFGRIFLIERDPTPKALDSGLTIVKTYTQGINPDDFADASFEGLACAASTVVQGTYNILLGDRKSGKLYSTKIDPLEDSLTNGRTALDLKLVGQINAPSEWDTKRSISDLFYNTEEHTLYGVASSDPGDDSAKQPHSTIYQATHPFHLEDDQFIQNISSPEKIDIKKLRDFPHDKVEGITGYNMKDGIFWGSDNDKKGSNNGYFYEY